MSKPFMSTIGSSYAAIRPWPLFIDPFPSLQASCQIVIVRLARIGQAISHSVYSNIHIQFRCSRRHISLLSLIFISFRIFIVQLTYAHSIFAIGFNRITHESQKVDTQARNSQLAVRKAPEQMESPRGSQSARRKTRPSREFRVQCLSRP
jgi:hypothetical protein